MEIIKYPNAETVDKCLSDNEPMLIVVAFDESKMAISCVDDSLEHHILLSQIGLRQRDIDKFFRVIYSDSVADWTFFCPNNYKNIEDKTTRIQKFYDDGFEVILRSLKKLGLNDISIEIPRRYQRHFIDMSNANMNELKDFKGRGR